MEQTIFIVDDEPRMRKLVGDFLKKEGFQILEAGDGEEACNIFFKHPEIVLIICDLMMPIMDGYETVKMIRHFSDVPIIVLTAKNQEMDEIEAFKMGIDDFISKPFSPKVLVSRVQAILKRSNPFQNKDILRVGPVTLNKLRHEVLIDNREIELSSKEFELLEYFMINHGIALSRERILNHVWDYNYFGDHRTIDTHVKKLRNKMGERGEMIKTVWGMGYKFEE